MAFSIHVSKYLGAYRVSCVHSTVTAGHYASSWHRSWRFEGDALPPADANVARLATIIRAWADALEAELTAASPRELPSPQG